MDACLMAMVEVGYQVRNYADYLVGSQEVELAYGWNYSDFLQGLVKNKLSPMEAAQAVVLTYEMYYKNKIQFYTQSAIDLSKIQLLKKSIDQVVVNIATCKAADNANFVNVVKKARGRCVQFSTASYIDLHSFLLELSKQVTETYERNNSRRDALLMVKLDALRESLNTSARIIEDVVVANTRGKCLERAKGLSIYFPQGCIDNSYPKTEFAQECSWFNFLQDILQK